MFYGVGYEQRKEANEFEAFLQFKMYISSSS